MKIIEKGTVVNFVCAACNCVFVKEINQAETQDNGENYYAVCPVCGAGCHADANARRDHEPGEFFPDFFAPS